MTITIIVAIAKNNAIGKNNDLLWHLPKDMAFFKETTDGHCIITGRKNYFSIPEKFRPLPNRTNIVVTRDENIKLEGALVVNSIQKAIEIAKSKDENEVFIIGGGQIYEQSIHLADKMYITEVDAIFDDADTFFPHFNNQHWKCETIFNQSADKKHEFNFSVKMYTLIHKN